jgi:uncharacterized protein YaaR (DUF327 family)
MPNAQLNNYTRNPAWKRIKEIDEKLQTLRKRALALRDERIKLVGDVYGRGNAANSSAR